MELRVIDEAQNPVPTACAMTADVDWSGPPYYADKNGRIRLTAVTGKDIVVLAPPRYADSRIPAAVWQTNRFPVVMLMLKPEERQRRPEPSPGN